MTKSNQAILSKRVTKTVELLLAGHSRSDIVQFASKNWKISDRQADDYIAKAKNELEKSVNRSVEYNLVKAERRMEMILKKALEQGELRTALATVKEIATLQGLYKNAVELSGNITVVSNIPD